MTWFRNIALIIGGFFLSIILIVVIDWCFGKYKNVQQNLSPFRVQEQSRDTDLGWIHPPNSSYTQERHFNDELIFRQEYSYDEFSRRKMNKPVEEKPKFALFFGCSQVFGEGLPADKTIPSLFEKQLSEYQSYNYGERGYGPQQMLAKLEEGFTANEIMQNEGLVLFVYYDFHINRTVGALDIIRWAGGDHPYYELDSNGELVRNGVFATGRPIRSYIYWLLSRSKILSHYNVQLPIKFTDSDYNLMCEVFKKARLKAAQLFTKARFVVVLGPSNTQLDPFPDTCLKQNNFETIDLRMSYEDSLKYRFKNDSHLNQKGSQWMTGEIVKYLKKN